jgi:hypothetical protein
MRFRFAGAVCVLLLALVATASASPLGLLGLSSSGTMDETLVSLFWTPDPTAVPSGPPWNAQVAPGTALSFSGGPLVLGEGVLINNGAAFCGGTNAVCPGGATTLPVATFLQFAAHPALVYELTGVNAGSPTDCSTNATVPCSIVIGGVHSPVVLTPIGTFGTALSIGLFGLASDAGIAGLPLGATWTGGFSATIPNLTPNQILHFFCPSGTCTAADVAASTVLHVDNVGGTFLSPPTAVPEPGAASMLLIGIALVRFGHFRRKDEESVRR